MAVEGPDGSFTFWIDDREIPPAPLSARGRRRRGCDVSTRRLELTATPDEAHALAQLADVAGVRASTYVRDAVLEGVEAIQGGAASRFIVPARLGAGRPPGRGFNRRRVPAAASSRRYSIRLTIAEWANAKSVAGVLCGGDLAQLARAMVNVASLQQGARLVFRQLSSPGRS